MWPLQETNKQALNAKIRRTETNGNKLLKKKANHTDMWIYSEIYLEITQIQMKFS